LNPLFIKSDKNRENNIRHLWYANRHRGGYRPCESCDFTRSNLWKLWFHKVKLS